MKLLLLLVLTGVFSYGTASTTFLEDITDILALIPVDDLKAVLDAHLENDGAVNAVVQYVQGTDWHLLIHDIEDMQHWQNFVVFMQDYDISVPDVIEAIHEFLESLPVGEVDEDGSLRPFLDEINALVPYVEVLDLIEYKFNSSIEFNEVYDFSSSKDSRQFVEDVGQLEEAERIAERLRSFDVDVDGFIKLLYEFFQWV